MKNITLKYLLFCLVALSPFVAKSDKIAYIYDITDDYNELADSLTLQAGDLSTETMAKLLTGDVLPTPVIECFDTKGESYLLPLLEQNPYVKDSIDITKPMVMHLMVGNEEMPLGAYKFKYTFGITGCVWITGNKKILSDEVKAEFRRFFTRGIAGTIQFTKLGEPSIEVKTDNIGPFSRKKPNGVRFCY